MRRRLIKYAALITIVHFGLTILATYGSFTIFRGPSTPTETFWDHVLGVLQFPGRLLFEVSGDDLFQAIIWGANSLLWGCVLAYSFVLWKKSRTA